MYDNEHKDLDIIDKGLIDYKKALKCQYLLVEKRRTNLICDTLLLLEHPHTYTIGLTGKRENILLSDVELSKRNIKVIQTKRGGDVTYHGPGQIIGYFIVDFKQFGESINRFVFNIEEIFILLLKRYYTIESFRDSKHPGVWTKSGKILAIGIRVKNGIIFHGFAFNVNTDMSYFDHIIPCGISGKKATSLASLINIHNKLSHIKRLIIQQLLTVFNYHIK